MSSVKFNIVEGSIKARKYLEEPKCPGMEAVHHPEGRPWIGPKMKLSEHFDKFSTLVKYFTVVDENFYLQIAFDIDVKFGNRLIPSC